MNDEIGLRKGSKWWYAGLIPVLLSIMWGVWVLQPELPTQYDTGEPSGPPLSKQKFDRPWLNSIAQAYGNTVIPPTEFQQCYEQLRDAALRLPTDRFVCDIFARRDFTPNLTRQIRATPIGQRSQLFRAHEIYVAVFGISDEIRALVGTVNVTGRLTASEARRAEQILVDLETLENRLGQLEVQPYLWDGYSDLLEESILDVRTILNGEAPGKHKNRERQ